MSSKFFSQALWHSSRRNKIGLDLRLFSTNQKNSAVNEPWTGHFGGLAGFETKAKDFKLCPRGQGRPRGLHLCCVCEKVADPWFRSWSMYDLLPPATELDGFSFQRLKIKINKKSMK